MTTETTQSTPDLSTQPSSNECSTFGQKTWAYQENFVQTIQYYQNTSKDPSLRALDLRGQHTWSEVIEKARRAEADYLAAGQTGMRRRLRTFSSYAQAADPLLKLIPNDKYLSVLAGGLKLVFDAAARINKHREEILRKLVQIPLVILHAEECCAIYEHDAELYAFAEILFVSALAAIEGIINWLERKSINKQIRSMLAGELYSKPFNEKMLDLDEALVNLEAKADRMQHATVQSTSREVKIMQTRMQDQADQMDRHEQRLGKLLRILENHQEHAKWMKRTESGIRRNGNRIHDLEQANSAMTLAEFIELLDVDNHHPLNDLQAMVRFDSTTEADDNNLAFGILEGEPFQVWHKDGHSMALMVEGATSTLESRRASPLSLLCSQLIRLQESSPYASVLYFFCGHHTSDADSLTGPVGMMRSLIRQVLRAYPNLKLNFLSPKLRSQLNSAVPDVRALGTCVRHLVSQIPAGGVVFCVIDGICFFEKKRWSEDCHKAVDDLLQLTQDESMYPVVKLFVTSPSRTRYVSKIFPKECRLNMDTQNERAQPTERQVLTANMKARRNMRESMRRSSYDPRATLEDTDTASVVLDRSDDGE